MSDVFLNFESNSLNGSYHPAWFQSEDRSHHARFNVMESTFCNNGEKNKIIISSSFLFLLLSTIIHPVVCLINLRYAEIVQILW